MSEKQTDTETEKLRAFEKKMHDEGAAGFADGPSPWETWDDETGLDGNKRVWEGKSRRIYPKQPQQSLGDRILSGLAMLSLATMAVGIAGVYFSDPHPGRTLASGVQPLPIDRTPAAAPDGIAALEQLPAPAAGDIETAKPAAGDDRNDSAPLAAPETSTATTVAKADDSTEHEPDLPAIAAAIPPSASADSASETATHSATAGHSAMQDSELSPIAAARPASASADGASETATHSTPAGYSAMQDSELSPIAAARPASASADGASETATHSAPAAEPAHVPADTAEAAGDSVTETANDMTTRDTAKNIAIPPATTYGNAPAGTQPALAAAPVTVTVTVTTGNAASPAATAVDTPAVSGADAATTAVPPATGLPVLADTVDPVANSTATNTGQPTRPAPLAVPVAAPAPEPAVETGPAADVAAVSAPPASAMTVPTPSDPAPGVASLEMLPPTSAGPESTDGPALADTPVTEAPKATETAIAAAEPSGRIVPTTPAKAVEQAAATVKTGDWVVNLASYTRKSTARRMLQEFRDQGVDAELVSVMINDAPMHRIRVGGFANSRAAKASIGKLEQQLGLEGIWISRR